MQPEIPTLIETLLRKKVIGGKHTPEGKILKTISRRVEHKHRKEFFKEYENLIKEQIIIRERKRTKRSYDWHISLNPRKMEEINNLTEGTR